MPDASGQADRGAPTMSALGLSPPAASTEPLFRTGGDFYITLPKLLFHELRQLLPKAELAAAVNAAIRVMAFLVEMAREEKLDALLTDQVIADEIGISKRSVQRGLWALDVVLGKIGLAVIKRIPSHGRRLISFVRGFAARGQSAPPFTPPKTSGTTTTRGPSSSLDSGEETPSESRVSVPPGLIDRAVRLIPTATEGRVIDAVAAYGAEWVSRVLDLVEKRNGKPGMLPVRSWGFVLNTLKNWKREGGPPPLEPRPAAAPARGVARPAKEEPPPRLTAASLADLLSECRSRNPAVARFARVRLSKALEEGAIPAELLATIPAELKEPTKPRAP
jgi:hypothetical protein